MCGIVGSIGNSMAVNQVLKGLSLLEYRGYDSCGIAYTNGDNVEVIKSTDRVQSLIDSVDGTSSVSFGHTRWATHGVVSKDNAHPHTSANDELIFVHNGVIENQNELKALYCNDINLKSQTDTEIILNVLYKLYKKYDNLEIAIQKFMDVVDGSYAIIAYLKDNPDNLYVIKHKSPILIGLGDKYHTISSDAQAVIEEVNMFYQLEDYCFANVSKAQVVIKNRDLEIVNFEFKKYDLDYEIRSTNGYNSYMQKEIEQQPNAIRNIVSYYQQLGFDQNLIDDMKNASRIYIIGCGTSYNSGLFCQSIIEKQLKIPVEVHIASEYGYNDNIIDDNGFFIFLSQSGETADAMLVFNQLKNKYKILAITNTRGSQMDRNADYSLELFAGVEVAVASTKSYTCQSAVLLCLTGAIAKEDGIYNDLLLVANAQEVLINSQLDLKPLASRVAKFSEGFYIGRLSDYALSCECALKVKEVTYINFNAMPSGELKHGTISLIDESKVVLGLVSNTKTGSNTRSNLEEIKSRGGQVIVFSTTDTKVIGDDFVIKYTGAEYLAPLVSVVVHQYLALFICEELGYDVDMPRNLAKSVTVE